MEDIKPDEISKSSNSSTSQVFRQFQELYTTQLKNTDDSNDGLKLKVKILQNWVEDLTDQNEALLKTVDELEDEALKRLINIEANIPQTTQRTSREMLTSKGLDKVDCLNKELEQVKQQLSDKEKLMSRYQSRIEQLRDMVQKDKSDKIFVHRCSMTEGTMYSTEKLNQPSVCKELETTQIQLCQMEKEVTQLKKKLKEADCNVKRLRSDLVCSEKNAREMRSALTAEVADKHDQVLALRREVNQLEDQLRQADMQTHFKDDIIKELRKEVKVARSKETLVEVLGIKERSLTHLEQLTEQLEQKENMISCLQAQLQQSHPRQDTLYRVKQQVDWFTDSMLQQCSKGNVPEEFKKCITTMLEELRESIDCCNLGPSNTTEGCKESLGFVSALQTSLDQCQQGLSQSWASIRDITDEINNIDLTPCIEQWKKSYCKQQAIQNKFQEVLHSILKMLTSSDINTKDLMTSIESVHFSLTSIQQELNVQLSGRNIKNWLDNMHWLVSEAIVKIDGVSQTFANFSEGEGSVWRGLQSRQRSVETIAVELDQLLAVQHTVYDRLFKLNKAQRTRLDTVLATVLHHQEAWSEYSRVWNDLNKELHTLAQRINHQQTKPRKGKKTQGSMEQRSLHVKSLVTKISSEIRESISDIEHRQSQATHLEVDLSSIRVVLESAQDEMLNITKDCKSKDIPQMVTCLLNKLKKELNNAMKKTDSLVEIYNDTKKDYMKSSKRILQIQREFDCLEEELHNFHYYICQDFIEDPKTSKCGKKICPIQEELENFKNKSPEVKEKVPCNKKNLKEQYTEMERTLLEKDAAIKNVKNNVLELKSNIKERDQLESNQEETICLLQNSLAICQKEGYDLRKRVKYLECKKEEVENEWKKKTECLQKKIFELQTALNQSEEMTLSLKGGVGVLCKMMFTELKAQYLQSFGEGWKECESLRIVQNANVELATIAGQVQEDYRCLQLRYSHIQKQMIESEIVHQRAASALQLVIANTKQSLCEEQRRLSKALKEKKKVEEQLTNAKTDYKAEVENLKEKEKGNQLKIDELTKQAKCWSAKVSEIEGQLKTIQEKLCETLKSKEDIGHQLSSKEVNYKREICEKQKEINRLTAAINSLTEQLKDTESELKCEQTKHCETEERLVSLCTAYDQLKLKAKEKDITAEKLHAALTQLSNKFVSRRLDTKDSVRHYQEECAKFEALYNTTACKLHSNELEMTALIEENERLKNELHQMAMCPPEEKEEESCPFLLGRVQQLTKELMIANSCQSNYETLLREVTEKCSKKEEEVSQLKSQLNQSNLQMQSLQRLLCNSQSVDTGTALQLQLQPNIELQREISSALSSQLRGVKQRLHVTRHEYKKLQANYEDLNRKYSLLQKSEKELEHPKSNRSHCTPCTSKVSKSVVHFRHLEGAKGDEQLSRSSSHSKSWHKFEAKDDVEDRGRIWKQRLKGINSKDDFDPSSSSN